MISSEEISTPKRTNMEMFPSSPDSRFSSPFGFNTWTPGRAPHWPAGLNLADSSPSHRFSNTSFSTPSSLDLSQNQSSDYSGQKGDNCKRGRPRADVITHLIHQGSASPNAIKCKVCNRVFPREKSLQAHLRTHTGERPYVCDYPGCTRTFTQSGQLKTHQRLHAGEKPFVCSAPGCGNRYTHANRTCPLHPFDKPQRSAEVLLQPTIAAGEDANQVACWLENYRRERTDKTPAKIDVTTNHSDFGTPLRASSNTTLNLLSMSPFDLSPLTTFDSNLSKKVKTKRGLASELEQENSFTKFPQFNHTPMKIPHLFNYSPENKTNHFQDSMSAIYSPSLLQSPSKIPTDLSTKRAALGDITLVKNENPPSSPNHNQQFLSSPPSSPNRRLFLRDSPESSPSRRLLFRDISVSTPSHHLMLRSSPQSSPSRKALLRQSPRGSPSRRLFMQQNFTTSPNRSLLIRDSPSGSPSRRLLFRDIPSSSPSRHLLLRDSPQSSPSRRALLRQSPPSSPVKTLNLKKRWLKEVDQEKKKVEQVPLVEEPDIENLALPISWNDSENVEGYAEARNRQSPLAWSAIRTLVEMAEKDHNQGNNQQPLNLSTTKKKF